MLVRKEDLCAIDFEGLCIHDFTAGQALNASFAAIEVPRGASHREAWSKRSDKYYYVVSGQLHFSLNGVGLSLSQNSFVHVPKGQRFSYSNRSGGSAQLILVHVPSFDPESEVFSDETHEGP